MTQLDMAQMAWAHMGLEDTKVDKTLEVCELELDL
jgi:hypothetical protein